MLGAPDFDDLSRWRAGAGFVAAAAAPCAGSWTQALWPAGGRPACGWARKAGRSQCAPGSWAGKACARGRGMEAVIRTVRRWAVFWPIGVPCAFPSPFKKCSPTRKNRRRGEAAFFAAVRRRHAQATTTANICEAGSRATRTLRQRRNVSGREPSAAVGTREGSPERS